VDKKIFFLCLLIFWGIFSYTHLFSPPTSPLIDLTNNQSALNCRITYSAGRYIFEPFSLIIEYLLNATDWPKTIIFTYLWFLLLSSFFSVKPLRATLIYLTIIALGIIFPLTTPKLHPLFPAAVVDFHSHTYYSHDAIISPQENWRDHRRAGFNMSFITEHDNLNSSGKFSSLKFPVFPGAEVRTTEGISLLVLAQNEFNISELENLKIADLIKNSHQKNLLVVLPHWWKWSRPALSELVKAGIDGIEIYNTGYRLNANPAELTEFARKNNLFTIGSTDWHGWGNYTNVWTLLDHAEITDLWQKENRFRFTRVIVYHPQKKLTLQKHLIEPYFILADWCKRAGFINLLMLTFWLLLIYWLSQHKKIFSVLKLLISVLIAITLMGAAIKFLILWILLYPQNVSLIKTAPVYFLLSLCWFFATKKNFS